MERESSQQYSVIFSVKGEKFKQRNLPSRTTSLLSSAVNSVGTSLEFAAFGSGTTPNIAELEHSGFFFLSTTMAFAAVRTHFPRKNTRVFIDRAAIDKQLDKY